MGPHRGAGDGVCLRVSDPRPPKGRAPAVTGGLRKGELRRLDALQARSTRLTRGRRSLEALCGAVDRSALGRIRHLSEFSNAVSRRPPRHDPPAPSAPPAQSRVWGSAAPSTPRRASHHVFLGLLHPGRAVGRHLPVSWAERGRPVILANIPSPWFSTSHSGAGGQPVPVPPAAHSLPTSVAAAVGLRGAGGWWWCIPGPRRGLSAGRDLGLLLPEALGCCQPGLLWVCSWVWGVPSPQIPAGLGTGHFPWSPCLAMHVSYLVPVRGA